MTTTDMQIALVAAFPETFRMLNGECHYRCGVEGEDSQIDPLSDANATLEVVKTMRGRGWRFTLFQEGDGWHCICGQSGEQYSSDAATLPLAICEAALRALGRWTQ